MGAIDELVVSCEHGGHDIPEPYSKLFEGQASLLHSHRGWDAGALDLAQAIAARLHAPLHAATVSRLLVDLNRSLGHRSLFSDISASLSRGQREEVLQCHYRPYREAVEAAIGSRIVLGRTVLHLSVHSFAPVLDGLQRDADIGLLYDPAREREPGFCRAWQHSLSRSHPELRIRRNYPYRGRADGFTTYLRKRFAGDRYLGVEIEINQRQPLDRPDAWPAFRRLIVDALAGVLGWTDARGHQPC